MPHEQKADDDLRVRTEEVTETDEPRAAEEPAPVPEIDAEPRAEAGEEPARMFRSADADRFRAEWQRIQAEFVDDPREAVREANELLTEAIRSLTTAVKDLEGQWQQGSGGRTEDMRQALRRYRSVLNQLLDA